MGRGATVRAAQKLTVHEIMSLLMYGNSDAIGPAFEGQPTIFVNATRNFLTARGAAQLDEWVGMLGLMDIDRRFAVLRESGTNGTALIEAVRMGSAELVQILLDAGAAISINTLHLCADCAGLSPLMVGARLKEGELILRLLLDAGADVNQEDLTGCSALHHACDASELTAVSLLLQGDGSSGASRPCANGSTPLMIVANASRTVASEADVAIARLLTQASHASPERSSGVTSAHLSFGVVAVATLGGVLVVLLCLCRRCASRTKASSKGAEPPTSLHVAIPTSPTSHDLGAGKRRRKNSTRNRRDREWRLFASPDRPASRPSLTTFRWNPAVKEPFRALMVELGVSPLGAAILVLQFLSLFASCYHYHNQYNSSFNSSYFVCEPGMKGLASAATGLITHLFIMITSSIFIPEVLWGGPQRIGKYLRAINVISYWGFIVFAVASQNPCFTYSADWLPEWWINRCCLVAHVLFSSAVVFLVLSQQHETAWNNPWDMARSMFFWHSSIDCTAIVAAAAYGGWAGRTPLSYLAHFTEIGPALIKASGGLISSIAFASTNRCRLASTNYYNLAIWLLQASKVSTRSNAQVDSSVHERVDTPTAGQQRSGRSPLGRGQGLSAFKRVWRRPDLLTAVVFAGSACCTIHACPIMLVPFQVNIIVMCYYGGHLMLVGASDVPIQPQCILFYFATYVCHVMTAVQSLLKLQFACAGAECTVRALIPIGTVLFLTAVMTAACLGVKGVWTLVRSATIMATVIALVIVGATTTYPPGDISLLHALLAWGGVLL